MAEMTAEQFAQRLFDCGLLDTFQIDGVWGELGTREVNFDLFRNHLLRRELVTNFQVDRLLAGKRDGYFYGNWKVLYMIGSGTFARVYRAVHRDTGKVAAVKVLRSRFSNDHEKTEQFLREAEMVKPLRHPNIVPIFEVFSSGAAHYMVMDFVEGQNLRDFQRARGKFTPIEAFRIIGDILCGLDFAFSKGVTHRDLKLSNVLVSSKGRAQLVDFGLAAENIKDEGVKVSNARSIDYAGLERASGVRNGDLQSDIFFVGCMLYHLLSGQAPLVETRDRIQRLSMSRFHDVRPLSYWEPDLPQGVLAIVAKAMELDPKKRYATPGEMLGETRQMLARLEEKSGGAAGAASTRREGEGRAVFVVEGHMPLQETLRDKLKSLGYKVLVSNDPGRAIARFDTDPKLADCVVFGVASLGAAALKAFQQFAAAAATQRVPAVLLHQAKHQEQLAQLKLAAHHVPMALPLKFEDLRVNLRKLIDAAQGGKAG